MRQQALTLALVGACLAMAPACYTTKIAAPGMGPAMGPTHEQRQWFTLGGAVGLSDEAGAECPGGLSYAESEMSGMDILLQIGLSVAGVVAAVAVCDLPDDPTNDEAREFSSCAAFTAGIGPLLLGTRTVRYRCAGSSPVGPPGSPTWGAKRPRLSARETLSTYGVEHVPDDELVALVIGSGTRTRNCLQLARDALAELGSMTALGRATTQELAAVAGIGRPPRPPDCPMNATPTPSSSRM